MNKQAYLNELEKALKAAQVRDCAEILEEYAEHFERKLQDGYGEEEIAARLAPPKDIAGQFESMKPAAGAEKGSRMTLAAGRTLADILAGFFFILLYAWVFVLGVFSVASAGLGFALITGISLWNMIPHMPYICALLTGLTLLALAALSAIGTEYCRLYTAQLLKVYLRWRKAVLGDGGRLSPPPAMHPHIEAKKRRAMRSAALVSLVVFAVCCIAGLGSMMIAAGSPEPWHVWRWFQ